MHRPMLILLPFLVVLTALGSFAAAQDTVRLRNGTVESGRVEAENYDALQFKAKKGKEERVLKLAWNDVTELTYGSAPDYHQAVSQLSTGNVGAALPRLQGLVAGTTLRKEMRPAAMYQLASGQMRAGQYAEAAATLLELVKTNAKSRYLLPATRALVECHLALGNVEAGGEAIEAAFAAATEAGVDANQATAFDYFRGLLLEAKKDYAAAKARYQTATRSDNGAIPIGLMARLGLARCDRAAGHVDEARTAFRSIIDQGQGNEVLAGAWNGLGDIALQDGIKARSAEKVTDALFMHLRGVVVHAPAPGEGTAEYEHALAGAAEAFRQLGELETDEALKKQQALRSRQRLDQLRKEFPHSSYLPK